MRQKTVVARLLRGALYVALGAFFVLLLGSAYVIYCQHRTASEIAIVDPPGIESMERITLGGVDQQIYIRGENRENPVLLFLHGGPGFSEMVPVRHYNRELEEHFVVVNWDQRGTGKSYSRKIPSESMNLEQIVDDALELTLKLQERFAVEKIYLVGHSWGSIVGVHAADRHPEYYHAYVGVGQAVDFVEAEKISYEFTVDQARILDHQEALEELRQIGPPPYTVDEREKIGVQRKWLFEFGGEVYGETNNARYLLNLLKIHLLAPEYSVMDIVNLVRGNNLSQELMWDDLLTTDLPAQVPALEIPVYFLTGRGDYVTVFEKVEEYYDMLEAPHKELIWFDKSAHSPNFEEPDRFVEELTRIRDRHVRD